MCKLVTPFSNFKQQTNENLIWCLVTNFYNSWSVSYAIEHEIIPNLYPWTASLLSLKCMSKEGYGLWEIKCSSRHGTYYDHSWANYQLGRVVGRRAEILLWHVDKRGEREWGGENISGAIGERTNMLELLDYHWVLVPFGVSFHTSIHILEPTDLISVQKNRYIYQFQFSVCESDPVPIKTINNSTLSHLIWWRKNPWTTGINKKGNQYLFISPKQPMIQSQTTYERLFQT